MDIQANIKNPCPENWEKMKIGLNSRFCYNCQKDVIDFTNKDRKEILEYLMLNYGKRVCGHIFPHQLDFKHTDFLITINALTRKSKNQNLSFFLLTLGTLVLASCSNQDVNIVNKIEQTSEIRNDTLSKKTSECNDITHKHNSNDEIISAFEGEVAIYPDSSFKQTEPYVLVDTMPEFYGGIDSLTSFIKKNLQYPNWEKLKNIQGVVYVAFVVDKTGKVKDAQILRSVHGSKNFDKEVIRIMNIMPDWKPGMLDGKHVDVQFNMPIRFIL